jgi:hypothetical protein
LWRRCGIGIDLLPAGGAKGQKQPQRDRRGTERDQRTDEEGRIEAEAAGDQAERRTAEAERHIEKDGVGAHGEAAALRRRAAHGFDAEAGINERIAEAGERGSGRGRSAAGCEPDHRKAGRFDQHAE